MSEEARPRNATATRQAILLSARAHFQHCGYDNVGVRAIAADAGIDPALISRYFGSKRQLFEEALESASQDPMQVFRGDPTTCGERVAAAVLDPDTDKARHMVFLGLVIGAASSPEASQMAHAHIERNFINPFCEWLGGERAQDKAWVICSLLMGAVIMKNIQPDYSPTQHFLAGQIQQVIDA